ncbi:MAG: RNA polymerase sigma factor [Bacteroidia bacterium]|nr:RNA polymerase sigma factor [Bacteroidia bacterium]
MTINEYKTVVGELGPRLLQFADYQVGSIEVAKDLVQESFIVLLDKRENVEPAKAKAFLYAVLTNKTRDHFKLKKKQVEVQDYHRIEEDKQAKLDSKELVKLALSKLNERERDLICLRDLEGYAYDEIAEKMELSLTQVKVYLFRARKALKNEIIKLEVEVRL